MLGETRADLPKDVCAIMWGFCDQCMSRPGKHNKSKQQQPKNKKRRK